MGKISESFVRLFERVDDRSDLDRDSGRQLEKFRSVLSRIGRDAPQILLLEDVPVIGE